MVLLADAREAIRGLREQGWSDELIAEAFRYSGRERSVRAYLAALDLAAPRPREPHDLRRVDHHRRAPARPPISP